MKTESKCVHISKSVRGGVTLPDDVLEENKEKMWTLGVLLSVMLLSTSPLRERFVSSFKGHLGPWVVFHL